jgi:protein-L-isoaspartate(D-aspartate) O-methyltransferase
MTFSWKSCVLRGHKCSKVKSCTCQFTYVRTFHRLHLLRLWTPTILLMIINFQHAYALELLRDQLKEGNKALDVGSGSGYLTVCFAHMVGESGKVIGIDHIKQLVEWSELNVKKNNSELLTSGRVKLVVGDGRLGYPQDGPYHAIHVGAAAPTLPQPVS